MNRTVFFIDGFNLYHSLLDPHSGRSQYKWLNLRKLAEQYLLSKDILTDILYFSALPTWNAEKRNNHEAYLHALESENIQIILGKFKKVTRNCLLTCNLGRNNSFETFEEKETDVNIAIHLLEYGLTDRFDKAIIVSGDSDLIPPIKRVKELSPHKIIGCVIPKQGHDLGNHCDQRVRLKESILKNSLFPREIKFKGKTIVCPKHDWLPQ